VVIAERFQYVDNVNEIIIIMSAIIETQSAIMALVCDTHICPVFRAETTGGCDGT
jgi:hypothetical protein